MWMSAMNTERTSPLTAEAVCAAAMCAARTDERIDRPARPRHSFVRTESVQQKLVSQRHLIDLIDSNGGCFVMHAPSSVRHFHLSRFNESFESLPHLRRLLQPPWMKEGHLHLHEPPRGVRLQRGNDRVHAVLHAGGTDGLVAEGEEGEGRGSNKSHVSQAVSSQKKTCQQAAFVRGCMRD
jgi:hypothetical protein